MPIYDHRWLCQCAIEASWLLVTTSYHLIGFAIVWQPYTMLHYPVGVQKQLFHFDKCQIQTYTMYIRICIHILISLYQIWFCHMSFWHTIQCLNPTGALLSPLFWHLALVLLPMAYSVSTLLVFFFTPGIGIGVACGILCFNPPGAILTSGTGVASGITPLWSPLCTVKVSLSVKVVGAGSSRGFLQAGISWPKIWIANTSFAGPFITDVSCWNLSCAQGRFSLDSREHFSKIIRFGGNNLPLFKACLSVEVVWVGSCKCFLQEKHFMTTTKKIGFGH